MWISFTLNLIAYMITLPLKRLSYYPVTESGILRRQQEGFVTVHSEYGDTAMDFVYEVFMTFICKN
jgi:hypothetical protein